MTPATSPAISNTATPGAGKPTLSTPSNPGMTAPTLDSVQPAGATVTLGWTDQSTNEDAFQVLRRSSDSGSPQSVKTVPTRDRAHQSGTYSFVDTVPAGTRQCYEIRDSNKEGAVNVSNEMCTSAPAALPAPAPGAGSIASLDTAGASGAESSIAIGSDGLGIISYYEGGAGGTDNDLRVSHCKNAACTTVTSTTIDAVGDVGQFSSIRIGGDGLALISYVSSADASHATEDLKVAHCVDVACTSATIATLDAAARVHGQTSLAVGGDGLGLISYEDDSGSGSTTTVKVAHCRDLACTIANLSVIDTANRDSGDSGGPGLAAIAVAPNGFGIVTYFDGAPDADLKVTVCGNADCSANNTTTTVDTGAAGAATGGWSSVTVGRDGLGLISYNGNATAAGSDLDVAHCRNVYCTSVTITTADTGGSTGWNTSITVGGDGFGAVSYYDATNHDLKVAHCADLTCSTVTNTTVDAFGDVGRQSAIAPGRDGMPLISYVDSRKHLRVAHCGNPRCEGVLVTPF